MRLAVLGAALALAGCAGTVIPRGTQPPVPSPAPRPKPAKPATAPPRLATAPMITAPAPKPIMPVTPAAPIKPVDAVAGPAVSTLGITNDGAAQAIAAFRLSCTALLRRTDNTGLTRNEDWRPVCDAATGWSDRDAKRFFTSQFETVQVADGKAFATGYFEPEIAGSRVRDEAHQVPVYAKPDDLIEVDLGQFSDGLKGKSVRGRRAGPDADPVL